MCVFSESISNVCLSRAYSIGLIWMKRACYFKQESCGATRIEFDSTIDLNVQIHSNGTT